MIGQLGLIGQICFLAILGLGIGSFLNVLIWRLDDEEAPKFWQGRSICPKCKHQLSWADNIPLLSFLLLRGKCRYCKKKISLQYPIVELTTAIVTVFMGLGDLRNLSDLGNLSWTSDTILFLVIAWAFIVIFFADWIYGLIPDEMEIVIVAATVPLILGMGGIRGIGENFLVGLGAAAVFFAIVVATKFQGMGLGDVKLAFVMGFLLGLPGSLVAFWASFILGGLFAVFLLLLKRRKIRDTIALGPFLVLGTLIAILFSNPILQLVGI